MISIVYWSQTGNTQAMAEAISEGVTEAGKEAKIIDVTDASLDALKTEKVFALGCPAMGAEVLNGEGLICQEVPNDDAIAECKALGKQLAAQ